MRSDPTTKKRARRLHTKKMQTFWQLLGEFVWLFSLAEVNIKDALWRLTEMQPHTARAVLSGVKIDTAMSLIRRLSEAEEWPQKRISEVDHVFRQLALINSFRNDILHHQGQVKGRKITVSNGFSAHIPERVRTTTISVGDLRRMNSDLAKIIFSLLYFSLGEDNRGSRVLLHKSAWRYKPLQPGSAGRKTRKSAPKSPPQPQSSQG
ncbi:hypothetical protein [Ferrovibrio terrae]|uniref:hypothetical protein n=1 Tax=Ferrovibrio terrae TaxID=2594003 RepID=UPI0031383E26